MEEIKIAHLSDLHCNSKEEWRNMFPYIMNCLKKIAPHIILVTGDLVHHPKKRHFLTLSKHFDSIRKKPQLPNNLHILVVPGNHDYFMFGNNFFNFYNRKKLYKKFEGDFFHPYGDYYDVLTSILVNFNIALFPLDSNSSNLSFGFAQGRINSPLLVFQKFSEYFQKISTAENINYDFVLKIAITHHHPLPIATSSKEESIERFLVLRNSYQFLESCRVTGIDIILHGHKHMSNLTNYTFFRNENKSITISSCSSSGNYDADRREIKSIEISNSGTINFQSYFSSQHNNDFIEEDKKYETKYYGDIRKVKNQTFCLLQKTNNCSVTNIKNKTKIISLLEDGSAFVTISLANIKWKNNIDRREKIIQERIRSDMGRVAGGFYEFSQCPITGEGLKEAWKNPSLISEVMPNPEKAEAFIKTFYPSNPDSGADEDCFKLNYYISCGFALTRREHEERYRSWDQDQPRQEYASISIDYPTDSIELIVRFPTDFYPPVKGIYIEASEKEDISKESGLKMLYRKMPVHKEETQFIIRKGVLRTRPEIDAIAVIIKYPQPNLEYILRWNLPENDNREFDQGQENKRKAIILSEAFNQEKNNHKVDKLYNELAQFVKSEVFADGMFSSFLLIYNSQHKYLEVARCEKQFQERITGKIIIGRGPAGKSFKRRKAVFWEKGCGQFAEDGLPDYPIEEVIKDLYPIKVFAMPLIFPAYISTGGEVGDNKQYICPAWGCLSLVSEFENSFKRLSILAPENQERELGQIFRCINKKLSECVKSSFPEIF